MVKHFKGAFVIATGLTLVAGAAFAQKPEKLGNAVDLLSESSATERTLRARVGPDETAFVTLSPISSGDYTLQLPAGKRLMLTLGGPVDTGYQVVNGDLRALPVGSTLNRTDGLFAWEPPTPFLGPFHLLFVNGSERVGVVATITDPSASAAINMQIDTPSAGATTHAPMVVAGWATDSRATTGAGIDTLHVWAYRRDAPVPPQFLGAAAVGGVRPDVAQLVGEQFERAGFTLTTPALVPGIYDLVIYAWAHRTGRFEDQRTVRVVVN